VPCAFISPTAAEFGTAIKYIDNFFESRGAGKDSLLSIEEEHVVGDHLCHNFDNLFHLATTLFAVNTAS